MTYGMKYRITVRGDGIELRGYLGEVLLQSATERLTAFAEAMKPYGLVVASVAEDDYNPFVNWTEDR
jgi:hypothetical protein